MNTTTLSDLRLRCRERADEVNSGFVSDAELTRLVNVKLQKLWDFLATQYNDGLIGPPVTLTLVDDQEWVSLPLDFKQAVQVFGLDGTTRIKMPKFQLGDLTSEVDVGGSVLSTVEPLAYRIIGRRMYIRPLNPSISGVELWYVPEVAKLENDYDTVSAYLPDGWEECIVNGVAALIKLKKEADATVYLGLESQYYTDLATYASERDSGEPQRVRDVTGWIR